jgi:hypothetical protein
MRGSLQWSLVFALLLFSVFLGAPAALFGQVDRGGILGLVTDPGGARVPSALVTVTNLATNQSVTPTTDENGRPTQRPTIAKSNSH